MYTRFIHEMLQKYIFICMYIRTNTNARNQLFKTSTVEKRVNVDIKHYTYLCCIFIYLFIFFYRLSMTHRCRGNAPAFVMERSNTLSSPSPKFLNTFTPAPGGQAAEGWFCVNFFYWSDRTNRHRRPALRYHTHTRHRRVVYNARNVLI